MKIYESAENYLETILILRQRRRDVRSIDIAAELDFTKPSVSVAMKKLRESGLILMDESGYITLTPDGQEIAERVYERHQFMANFLTQIGVPQQIAIEDACKIEHVISADSFAKLKAFAKQLSRDEPAH